MSFIVTAMRLAYSAIFQAHKQRIGRHGFCIFDPSFPAQSDWTACRPENNLGRDVFVALSTTDPFRFFAVAGRLTRVIWQVGEPGTEGGLPSDG
jgi:hypothetical protein